jgi:hypothetical protein
MLNPFLFLKIPENPEAQGAFCKIALSSSWSSEAARWCGSPSPDLPRRCTPLPADRRGDKIPVALLFLPRWLALFFLPLLSPLRAPPETIAPAAACCCRFWSPRSQTRSPSAPPPHAEPPHQRNRARSPLVAAAEPVFPAAIRAPPRLIRHRPASPDHADESIRLRVSRRASSPALPPLGAPAPPPESAAGAQSLRAWLPSEANLAWACLANVAAEMSFGPTCQPLWARLAPV